jgi:hypothetical protein
MCKVCCSSYTDSSILSLSQFSLPLLTCRVLSLLSFRVQTRVLSVWQHGWFDNVIMDYGVALEIAIILIIGLIPPDGFFNQRPFEGIIWLVPLVGWAGIFLINEPRKWLIRNVHGNRFVDFLAW